MRDLAHHAEFGIIQQRFAQSTEIARRPDQLGLVFHQAIDGQVSRVAHQFRGLFAGVLARYAGFDAEQWVGLVFALKEDGFADCAVRVFGGH